MAKFPEPPDPEALRALPAEETRLAAGTRLWRIYFAGGMHPGAWNRFRDFGPTTARFDHHLPPPRAQARAILYAAERGTTCFAEVFQATRLVDRRYDAPHLVALVLARPVRLLDLTGRWPTRAGASMALASGVRARARRWAQAVYSAYPELEGLRYASSMDGNRPAVALFERARDALAPRPDFHRALADPLLLPAVLRAAAEFGYALV